MVGTALCALAHPTTLAFAGDDDEWIVILMPVRETAAALARIPLPRYRRSYEHGAASRHPLAAAGQGNAVAAARQPAARGRHLGSRVRRALCRGVSRFHRLSLRVCAVARERPVALPRADRRSALPAGPGQHAALRRPRREREDVPRPAAV